MRWLLVLPGDGFTPRRGGRSAQATPEQAGRRGLLCPDYRTTADMEIVDFAGRVVCRESQVCGS